MRELSTVLPLSSPQNSANSPTNSDIPFFVSFALFSVSMFPLREPQSILDRKLGTQNAAQELENGGKREISGSKTLKISLTNQNLWQKKLRLKKR